MDFCSFGILDYSIFNLLLVLLFLFFKIRSLRLILLGQTLLLGLLGPWIGFHSGIFPLLILILVITWYSDGFHL